MTCCLFDVPLSLQQLSHLAPGLSLALPSPFSAFPCHVGLCLDCAGASTAAMLRCALAVRTKGVEQLCKAIARAHSGCSASHAKSLGRRVKRDVATTKDGESVGWCAGVDVKREGEGEGEGEENETCFSLSLFSPFCPSLSPSSFPLPPSLSTDNIQLHPFQCGGGRGRHSQLRRRHPLDENAR